MLSLVRSSTSVSLIGSMTVAALLFAVLNSFSLTILLRTRAWQKTKECTVESQQKIISYLKVIFAVWRDWWRFWKDFSSPQSRKMNMTGSCHPLVDPKDEIPFLYDVLVSNFLWRDHSHSINQRISSLLLKTVLQKRDIILQVMLSNVEAHYLPWMMSKCGLTTDKWPPQS